VLTPAEADHLFRILKGLKDQGKTIILITHKLREIMEATDNVSVMRRGTMVATVKTAETSPEGAGRADGRPQGAAGGRKGPRQARRRGAGGAGPAGARRTRVERLKGVSFDIRAGEISASPASPATASRNCWPRLAA
jgi:ABC-type uncharacterized transport system ATPase subunit